MAVKVVKFTMHDFFTKLRDSFGAELQYDWVSGWSAENYDSEGIVDRQCSNATTDLSKISLPPKETVNTKGVKLIEENTLVSFDWGWSKTIDARVEKEIQDIIESTLQLNYTLDQPNNWTLHEIVCNSVR
ncbi:MAG: hypothetical protein KA536_11525 [Saprospiraceae bacterium]|nr:hypothetical protein [Saprospiraceae bacterium]